MSDKNTGRNIILVLLGALWGIGFGLFMSRKPGKSLRKEILDKWDNGESLPKAKWDVFLREAMLAFKGVPEAFDEFLKTKHMEEYKEKGHDMMEKGKKLIDEKLEEGRKIMDEELEKGKKVVTKKVKEGKKIAKKKIKEVKGKVEKKAKEAKKRLKK